MDNQEGLNMSGTETNAEEKGTEKKLNPALLIFPSFFDMTETCLKNVTLTLIATSVT